MTRNSPFWDIYTHLDDTATSSLLSIIYSNDNWYINHSHECNFASDFPFLLKVYLGRTEPCATCYPYSTKIIINKLTSVMKNGKWIPPLGAYLPLGPMYLKLDWYLPFLQIITNTLILGNTWKIIIITLFCIRKYYLVINVITSFNMNDI